MPDGRAPRDDEPVGLGVSARRRRGAVHGGHRPRHHKAFNRPISDVTLRLPELSRPRMLFLMAAGFTTVVPIMKFTVTGFSFICLLLVILFFDRLENRRAGAPLLLAFAGTVAYVISSLVNHTSLLAPNVPAFTAFALYLCGLLIITSSLAELFAVMVGVSFGTLGFYAVLGTALTSDGLASALWKYGFAPAVTLLVLYAIAQLPRHRPMLGCAALAALATLSIVLNFRSHALICLSAALLLAIDQLRRRPTTLPVKVVTIAVVGGLVSSALEYAARSGLLGSALTDKVEMQASQHVPSILVGRSEPPLSISAIIDHPLLGWGYADNISSRVFDHAYQLATDIGFDSSYPFRYIWYLPNGSVSLHSILLGSWAEGGVVAVLLPLWLVWACLTLIRYAHRHARFGALLIFLGIQGIWDLLFSPWSYNLPVVYAAISLAALYIIAERPPKARRKLMSLPPPRDASLRARTPPQEPTPGHVGVVSVDSEPALTADHQHPRLRRAEAASSAVDSNVSRQRSSPVSRRGREPLSPSANRGRHAAPDRSTR